MLPLRRYLICLLTLALILAAGADPARGLPKQRTVRSKKDVRDRASRFGAGAWKRRIHLRGRHARGPRALRRRALKQRALKQRRSSKRALKRRKAPVARGAKGRSRLRRLFERGAAQRATRKTARSKQAEKIEAPAGPPAKKKISARVAGAVKKAGRWIRQHPKQAIGIGLGTAAMFATVFTVAPVLSAGVAGWLAPVIGKTGATIVGTASGGALACGVRSLLVHATPMVTKVDPFNARQLGTDVAMSSTFGFFGFAQAAALKTLTTLTGASGVGLFAMNFVGLIGYELGKDYLQNRIRNRVANDPKKFREIWLKSLAMETASNVHRCIPGLGLETSFGAKIVGDLGGTVWWDRIVNKRNKSKHGPAHNALTE